MILHRKMFQLGGGGGGDILIQNLQSNTKNELCHQCKLISKSTFLIVLSRIAVACIVFRQKLHNTVA